MNKNIQFEQELSALLNRYSYDNDAEIPDYRLARCMMICLNNILDMVTYLKNSLSESNTTSHHTNKENDRWMNDDEDADMLEDLEDVDDTPSANVKDDNKYFDKDIFMVRVYADGTERWYYDDYLIQETSGEDEVFDTSFLNMFEHISKDKKVSTLVDQFFVAIDQKGHIAPHQARALASRPECGCSAIQSKGETA